MLTVDVEAIKNNFLRAIAQGSGNHQRPSVPRCSQIGRCMRMQWLELMGYESAPADGGRELAARQGNWQEEPVYGYLQAAGYTVHSTQESIFYHTYHGEEEKAPLTCTVPLSTSTGWQLLFSGHIDGIIEGPGLSERHLLELKALRAQAYIELATKGVEAAEPAYYMQVQLYMHALNLPGCIFIAVAKDQSSVRSMQRLYQANNGKGIMWFRPDPEMVVRPGDIDSVLHIEHIPYDEDAAVLGVLRAKELLRCVGDRTPAQREFDPYGDDWQCRYCDYRDACLATGA